MTDDGSIITDADIALKMAMGDQEGLRLLLETYGGRMKAYLFKRYRSVLQEGELEEAFNAAIYNVWRFADRYDESKGTLASWCIRVAQNAARSILRRETKYRSKNLEYDPNYDPAGDPSDAGVFGGDYNDDPRLDVLLQAVETLPPLQKAIIQADLAADGSADARRLAEIHGTSMNSIHVSRNKAHKSLQRQVEQITNQPVTERS